MARALSEQQLEEMMELLRGADTVELKLSIPAEHHRSTVVALGMDVMDAQIRQVFFFDTPDLALDRAGVVVRARRVQGKVGDSVVKLRPVVPSELPKSLRKLPGFGVEVDAMPGGFVCSGRLKEVADNGLIRRATNVYDNKTLIIHPASTIFCDFDSAKREKMHVSDHCMRLSLGIEDIEDLKNDILQALS